jgi:hypothetical protein
LISCFAAEALRIALSACNGQPWRPVHALSIQETQ